ncbi:MAG: outer membrane protein assembly factor [Fimbriimonadaceae bacterium]
MRRLLGLSVLAVCCVTLAVSQSQGVVNEVIVRGNSNVSTEAILLIMRTRPNQPFVAANLDADKAAIQNLGFFRAVDVNAEPVGENLFNVIVDVSEFGQIKELRVVGNTVVTTEQIEQAIPLKVGDVFNLRQLEPTANAIVKLYQDRGYFASIDDISMLEESPGTLSIVIRELTVESVTFSGNTRTRDWVMKRLIKTRPGEIFSARRWEQDLRRLIGTQWFEDVRSEEQVNPTDATVALSAAVQEGRTGNFNVGLVLDPRSGFAGTIRLADSNFRGTGQTVGIDFLQGTRGGGPSVTLSYANPFLDEQDTSLSVDLYSRVVYRFIGDLFGGSNIVGTGQYYERRTGGTIALGRPVNDQLTLSVGVRAENIRTSGVDSAAFSNFVRQDGTLAILGFGALLNRRDVDVDPSRGDWYRFTIEPGYADITRIGGAIIDPSILGTNFFTKLQGEFRTYWSDQGPRPRNQLDAPRRVLAFRLRAGTIAGKAPFFEQFFVGGTETLRGWPEDRFWGKNMLATSVEYRYPIQRGFSAVAFVDAASAWGGFGSVSNFTQSQNFNLNFGYGLGLAFRTPLGPIRLDFGLNNRGGTQTHLAIGTSF